MQKEKFKIQKKVAVLLLCYFFLLFHGCENPFISEGDGGIKVVTGTVKRGVEAGCWILVSTSGNSYELYGEKSSEIKKEGLKVRVFGKVKKVASYCMQGTPLEIITYQILD